MPLGCHCRAVLGILECEQSDKILFHELSGDWKAYEVKFQGTGTATNGEQITVWGRRLFIPAARPGVRNGFEVTMLATSLADDVKSVEDVGVHGELAPILYSFEPSQNF